MDQSQQFRKLSQDLFEAIGLRESENDFENRMQQLKEHYEGVIGQLQGQVQLITDELDINKIKKDLQNFTFTQMNERQEQIVNQLMLYMQKLISQQNMQNQQQASSKVDLMKELALTNQVREDVDGVRGELKGLDQKLESITK